MHRGLGPVLVLMLASVVSLTGCGSENFLLAPVSGRVTVDGQPVTGLRVGFEPVGSAQKPVPGPGSIGITDTEGRFTLSTMSESPRRGAVVGSCRVRIWTLPSNQTDELFDDRTPNYDPRKEIAALREQIRNSRKKVTRPTGALPLRFNDQTELSFEVPVEGTDKANFDLSWK